jgi:ribosome-associated translation inhibitor RaiA
MLQALWLLFLQGVIMQIEIRSRDFSVTDAIREHAQRRMRFVLDYFAFDRLRNVRRIVVRLGDLNGPKGGVDKYCRIIADVGSNTVVVENTHSNLYSAISLATQRFALKASRVLSRDYQLTDRTRAADVFVA